MAQLAVYKLYRLYVRIKNGYRHPSSYTSVVEAAVGVPIAVLLRHGAVAPLGISADLYSLQNAAANDGQCITH